MMTMTLMDTQGRQAHLFHTNSIGHFSVSTRRDSSLLVIHEADTIYPMGLGLRGMRCSFLFAWQAPKGGDLSPWRVSASPHPHGLPDSGDHRPEVLFSQRRTGTISLLLYNTIIVIHSQYNNTISRMSKKHISNIYIYIIIHIIIYQHHYELHYVTLYSQVFIVNNHPFFPLCWPATCRVFQVWL